MTEESERVQLTVKECESFWRAFLDDEPRLARLPLGEFVNEANELLERFVQDIALEVQGIKDDPMENSQEADISDNAIPVRELIISAHGVREHFPDLLMLASQAPTLHHYKLVAFRMRTDEPSFGMRMEDFELSTEDILVACYTDRGLIGLELKFIKPIPMDMVEHAQNMAMIMIDHVLGEFDFAVRVGSVDFVDEFSADGGTRTSLPLLPSAFDNFWRNVLGRDGYLDFNADTGSWTMLSAGSKDDPSQNSDPSMPWITSIYDDAHRVATRADLGYRIDATVCYDNQEELDRARDLQETWIVHLQKTQSVVMAMTKVSVGSNERTCTFYADSPDSYSKNMRVFAEQHHFTDLYLTSTYDPSWNAYFSVLPESKT